MIAIKVTKELKDRNNLSDAVGSIMTRSSYPNAWWGAERVIGGYASLTDLHGADGWKDVVQPTITNTQRKGDIYLDGAVYTYHVIDFTDEELEARIVSQSESNKQSQIQQKMELEAVASIVASTDPGEILRYIDVFDFWSGDGVPLEVGDKVKYIDNLELKLYRVEQAHTTQEGWTPPTLPALFTRVAEEGQILAWVEPSGAQDAYMTGDKVHFPTLSDPVYISVIDNNTWSPIGYPQGWELV